jgi:hypothetical protein
LIVCEGESTEPSYFNKIRDILLDEKLNVTINIKPRQKEEVKQEEFMLRSGGKRRNLQKPEEVIPECEIEEKFKAQPTRYVREAQMGLEDGSQDEVWAVFDKDGHARPQEAFELANNEINGKKVNIVFNSIAFEFWILLHFEYSTTAFQKSMCRIEQDELMCGKNTHPEDCMGTKCACGRIVSEAYLKYEKDRKSFNFNIFHPNVTYAIQRAIKLRKSYNGTHSPIYELNPYTSTDRLVFKLLHLKQYDFLWFKFDELQKVENLHILLSGTNGIINFQINRITDRTEIVSKELFCIFDVNGNKTDCGQRKVMIEEAYLYSFDVKTIDDFSPLYIGIRINEYKYLISELPF